ncbi:MAG: hypothetical protein Q7T82_11400 [Armatimonadota bacterium]|nr:hypothetical protein [Armatimonadota bacterium]
MPEASPPRKFAYSVDGQPFATEVPVITVALLRAKLPAEKRGFGILVEGTGNEPDRWLADEDKISLENEKAPRRFYSSPPAMFG